MAYRRIMGEVWQPSAQVEIVAGTPPGGGQDRAARALADVLEPLLPFGVTVSNISGRGGGNAWDSLFSRQGDAHLLSISSPTLITNKLLGIADIDHHDLPAVGNLYTEYILFAVPAGSPITSSAALAAALVSQNPPTTALATERGNVNHIALGRVTMASGGNPATTPIRVFESARHAVADMLDGNAGVVAVSAPSVVPELEAGKLRAIAVSAPGRLAAPFADVPTWIEEGVDSVIGTWRGVVAAPGLNPDQIAFWDATIARALTGHRWAASLRQHGWQSTALDASATRVFLAEEQQVMSAALASLCLIAN
jgi:putative tricarboxylic transport membrane protein